MFAGVSLVEVLGMASILLGWSLLALVGLLTVRRLRSGHRARSEAAAEARVQALALALLEDDAGPAPPLARADSDALTRLLLRFARQLRGKPRSMIASHFESTGAVRGQLARLRRRRRSHRALAAYSLGDMGSASAADALVAALDDPHREVRAAAARSLGRLGDASAATSLIRAIVERRVPYGIGAHALLELGPDALPSLRGLAGSDEPDIRAFAMELIGVVGEPADAELLVAHLRDPAAEPRAGAARALGRLAAEHAAGSLRVALQDRVPFVRTNVAYALGRIGDVEALAPLIKMARTDSFDPARAAALAASQIDGAATTRAAVDLDPGGHLGEASDLWALEQA